MSTSWCVASPIDESIRAFSVIRHPLIFVSSIAAVVSCGCGLVRVPYVQELPARRLRTIIVHDLATEERLAGASVSFSIGPYENWLKPMPWWGVSDTSPEPEELPAAGPAAGEEVWAAVETQPGVFKLKPRAKWASFTIWCPLPPVLGCFLHHCYDGHIHVAAPGHKSLWLTNAMTADRIANGRRSDSAEGGWLEFKRDGVHVFLPRAHLDEPDPCGLMLGDQKPDAG
jgi:hypothetical protein